MFIFSSFIFSLYKHLRISGQNPHLRSKLRWDDWVICQRKMSKRSSSFSGLSEDADEVVVFSNDQITKQTGVNDANSFMV